MIKGKVRTGWQFVMKAHYKGKAWRLYRRKVLKVCNICLLRTSMGIRKRGKESRR